MIKISDEDWKTGAGQMEMVKRCTNAIYCLWGRLPEKECASRCPLILFRKEGEQVSPAFISFYKTASNYHNIMDNPDGMEFGDLYQFGYLSLCFFFAMCATAGHMPYISKELIKRVCGNFSLTSAMNEFSETNPPYDSFLKQGCLRFRNQERKYYLYLIIELFSKAVEEEKEKMHKNIETYLKRQRGQT